MKIHIEVDCTPEEARRFFGLPDVAPMQNELMRTLQQRLSEALRSVEPGSLLEQWLPLGMKGLEQWQSFWTQLASSAAAAAGQQGAGRRPGKPGEPSKKS